jgi:hypothetical protein
MRPAVEFIELRCDATKEPDEDEVTVRFNRTPLWSGPIRSGITRRLETIKVLSDESAVVELFEDDFARRTVNSLGVQKIQAADADSGDQKAEFATDGARYTLSYKVLQIPD